MPGSVLSSESKSALRRRCRTQRLEALPAAEPTIQAIALRELPARVPAGRFLGLYWPLSGEADLRQVLARALPGQLALPAIEEPLPGAQPRMVYRPWDPDAPLEPDACGIPAPPARGPALPLAPERLALLLAPALSLDRRGIRLGYGGGWFDRLRADPAWAAVPALAVLPAACRREQLPCDPWDIPLQGWLDETGLHWLQAV